ESDNSITSKASSSQGSGNGNAPASPGETKYNKKLEEILKKTIPDSMGRKIKENFKDLTENEKDELEVKAHSALGRYFELITFLSNNGEETQEIIDILTEYVVVKLTQKPNQEQNSLVSRLLQWQPQNKKELKEALNVIHQKIKGKNINLTDQEMFSMILQ